MAGNREGGRKAKAAMLELYGKDYYQRIGAIGGKLGKTGGFASLQVGKDGLTGKERARVAGKMGGSLSRRTGVPTNIRKEN